MPDKVTVAKRSEIMRAVRSKGNRSTEVAVEMVLRKHHLKGWKKHPADLPGRPDFFFAKARLAVFVDGCFWHACPRCARKVPADHHEFWKAKLSENRLRDRRVRRRLNALGIATLSIWEHEVSSLKWVDRLVQRLRDRDPGSNTGSRSDHRSPRRGRRERL